jgi:hypothetical protein
MGLTALNIGEINGKCRAGGAFDAIPSDDGTTRGASTCWRAPILSKRFIASSVFRDRDVLVSAFVP